MEDIRQTLEWAKYLRDKGWKTERLIAEDGQSKMNVFIVPLYVFGLTMLKLQRSSRDPNWKELKKIKRRHWVASSIIEPFRIQDKLGYKMAGYRISKFPYLSTKTYLVDLSLSKEQLWKNLSENAKREIKKNSGVKVMKVSPRKFLDLWRVSSKIWTMKENELISLKKAFGRKVRFLVSKDARGYHSGLLLICSKDTANYYQTWTSELGRSSGAHYLLVWKEMLRAKKIGLKFFDFEGIYDERWPQKRWKGFTEFKRRFGGKMVASPGSFFRWL